MENPEFNDKVLNFRDGKKVLLIGGGVAGIMAILAIAGNLLLKRKRIKIK